METTSEQISMTDALAYAHLKELPEKWEDKTKIWIMAIIKVTKVNARSNYAVAINEGDGRPTIIKDFGTSAMVARIDGIYPYKYLNTVSMPDLRSKQDIINYLGSFNYDVENVKYLLSTKNNGNEDKTEEQRKADRETVKMWVIRTAIRNEIGGYNAKSFARRVYNENKQREEAERKEERDLV